MVLMGVTRGAFEESGKFSYSRRPISERPLDGPATLSWLAMVTAFKTTCVDVQKERGVQHAVLVYMLHLMFYNRLCPLPSISPYRCALKHEAKLASTCSWPGVVLATSMRNRFFLMMDSVTCNI